MVRVPIPIGWARHLPPPSTSSKVGVRDRVSSILFSLIRPTRPGRGAAGRRRVDGGTVASVGVRGGGVERAGRDQHPRQEGPPDSLAWRPGLAWLAGSGLGARRQPDRRRASRQQSTCVIRQPADPPAKPDEPTGADPKGSGQAGQARPDQGPPRRQKGGLVDPTCSSIPTRLVPIHQPPPPPPPQTGPLASQAQP
ncbi:uncharacterized protein PSFLO_03256 [Pseudozyma flocculosa]|uniref:Uncharacterized protein n=1 Tax=Pseudozyma flocculosa TaxID=84751 RepID=A0A5C3F138_9BASI|nr:uncharacterized protein PSFLO_03256 [Pseudozyma flocculosa]